MKLSFDVLDFLIIMVTDALVLHVLGKPLSQWLLFLVCIIFDFWIKNTLSESSLS